MWQAARQPQCFSGQHVPKISKQKRWEVRIHRQHPLGPAILPATRGRLWAWPKAPLQALWEVRRKWSGGGWGELHNGKTGVGGGLAIYVGHAKLPGVRPMHKAKRKAGAGWSGRASTLCMVVSVSAVKTTLPTQLRKLENYC